MALLHNLVKKMRTARNNQSNPAAPKPTAFSRRVPEGMGFPNGLPMNNPNPVAPWSPPGMGHDFNVDARRLAQHQMPPANYMDHFQMNPNKMAWMNQQRPVMPEFKKPEIPAWLKQLQDAGILG